MDVASIVQVAVANFGLPGVVVAFLIWWTVRCDRQRVEQAKTIAVERKAEDEKRFNYDKERLAMDKDLSANLGALTSAIQALQGLVR